MKKNIIIGISGAIALFSFASCNPDRLNIPQKGVVASGDAVQVFVADFVKPGLDIHCTG